MINVRSVRAVYIVLNIHNISVLNKYYCIIKVKCLLQAFDEWFGTVMFHAFFVPLPLSFVHRWDWNKQFTCSYGMLKKRLSVSHQHNHTSTICLWTTIAFWYTDVVPLHSIVAQLWHEFRFKMSLRRVSVHYIRNTSNLKNR